VGEFFYSDRWGCQIIHFWMDFPVKAIQRVAPMSGLMIVGLSDPLVRWSAGPLIRWSADPLIRWSAGPLVR